MRIIVELDQTAGIVRAANTSEIEAVSQAATPPTAQSGALDGGRCSGVALNERSSVFPSQAINAGITSATSPAPTPHPDAFGIYEVAIRGNGGLDAGSCKG